MKKTYLSSRRTFAFMLLLAGLVYSCRKETVQKQSGTEQNADKTAKFIVEAKSYLDSTLKTNSAIIKVSGSGGNTSEPTTFNGYLDWDNAKTYFNKTYEVAEIPVSLDYKQVNFYKLVKDSSTVSDKSVTEKAFVRVLIYKDSTKNIIDKRIITYIPDKKYLEKNSDPSGNNWINSIDKNYSGYIEYRTWENIAFMVLRIDSGKVSAKYNVLLQGNTNLKTQGLKTSKVQCSTQIIDNYIMVCIGSSCSTSYKGTTYTTVCSGAADFDYPSPSAPSVNYGSPGSGYVAPASPALSDADIAKSIPIVNDNDPIDPMTFIKCFTDGKTASQYKLTIYIAQPTPGSNDQISFFSRRGETFRTSLGQLYNVGHAFVGFQKINNDGSTVTQVMGFYPNPQGMISDGVIKDDSSHPYDVSYTVNVNASQFQTALGAVIYDNGFRQYILSDYLGGGSEYNCVDAARTWLMIAGVALPQDTNRGSFLNSPGDYGQALRNFNGANTTSGNAPNSHGPCN